MAKVVAALTMSLDGFIAGLDDHPLDGSQHRSSRTYADRLEAWLSSDNS